MVPNEEEFNMAYSHRDGSHQPVEMLKTIYMTATGHCIHNWSGTNIA